MNDRLGWTERWQSWISNRNAQRAGGSLLLLLFLFLYVQTFRLDFEGKVRDFRHYLFSSKQVALGHDPYELNTPLAFHKCPYPMFLAFVMVPLTWLPFPVAGSIWFWLNAAALAGAVFLAIRILIVASHRTSIFSWLLPILIFTLAMFIPIQNNFRNGQVNAVVLFLCMLVFWGYIRKREWLTGIALAAAIAIKLLPAPLLLFFLIRKEWKITAITVGSSILFCLMPVVLLKQQLFIAYGQYIAEFLFHGSMLEHAQKDWRAPMTLYDIVTFVSSLEGVWLRILSIVFIVALTMGLDWKFGRTSRALSTQFLTFALYLAMALTIAPISEKHHALFLFPLLLWFYRSLLDTENRTNHYNPLMLFLFFLCTVMEKAVSQVPWYAFGILLLWIVGWMHIANANKSMD